MARRTTKPAAPALDASMPVVILHGKDDYQLRERARRFEQLLRDAHGDIEAFTFDGAGCELAEVLDELRSYGLLQQHKLVVLDNADRFLNAGASEGSRETRRRTALERYAAEPAGSATLLMRATTWRPGRLDKIVAEHGGAVVKCEPPTEATAARWCVERGRREHRVEIAPDTAALLVQLVGADLMHLDQELAKLAAYAGEGVIDSATVSELVGLSREEQAWEIQSAILRGDPAHALAKLRELLEIARLSEVLVSWAVCDLVRKLHAAAELTRRGEAPGTIASRLRLWGAARDAVLRAAAHGDSPRFARLMETAIEGDLRTKRGLAHPIRQLETLTVLAAESCCG